MVFQVGRKIFCVEEKNNGEGKGGKYLEKENIWQAEENITEKEKEENSS